jgi:hypothetical protein
MFDAATISDENLREYDHMMVEMHRRVRRFAPSANPIWAAVLRELEVRGQVQLLSGSYDEMRKANIRACCSSRSPAPKPGVARQRTSI